MRNSYRKKLEEKFTEAYKAEIPDVRPPAEDVERWIMAAEAKKKKRSRRFELAVGGIFNLAILLIIGITVLPGINDAHAGASHKMEIEEPDGDAEATTIEIYEDREDMPDELTKEFLVFPESFGGFTETEIRVTENNGAKVLEAKYVNEEEKTTIICQTKYTEEASAKSFVVPNSTREIWNETEVWITEANKISQENRYAFIYGDLFIYIAADKDVERSQIEKLVKDSI